MTVAVLINDPISTASVNERSGPLQGASPLDVGGGSERKSAFSHTLLADQIDRPRFYRPTGPRGPARQIAAGTAGALNLHYCGFCCAFSIFAHESRNDTVRLKTGSPSVESTESTQK